MNNVLYLLAPYFGDSSPERYLWQKKFGMTLALLAILLIGCSGEALVNNGAHPVADVESVSAKKNKIDLYGHIHFFADLQAAVRVAGVTVKLHGEFDLQGTALVLDAPEVTLKGDKMGSSLLSTIGSSIPLGDGEAIQISAPGVTVKDLKIDLTDHDGAAGIRVGDFDNCNAGLTAVIKNNVIGPVTGFFFGGVDVPCPAADLKITGNAITTQGFAIGIGLFASIAELKVSGNTVTALGSSLTGMWLQGSSGAIVSRNTIACDVGGSFHPIPGGLLVGFGESEITENVFVNIVANQAIRVAGANNRFESNNYTDSNLPGFDTGGGAVLLVSGSVDNYVSEHLFPPGTSLCNQIQDDGSNDVVGYEDLCGG